MESSSIGMFTIQYSRTSSFFHAFQSTQNRCSMMFETARSLHDSMPPLYFDQRKPNIQALFWVLSNPSRRLMSNAELPPKSIKSRVQGKYSLSQPGTNTGLYICPSSPSHPLFTLIHTYSTPPHLSTPYTSSSVRS